MRNRMVLYSLFLVLVLLPSLCLAKTVYVKTTGLDTNDGLTWDTAKKTIQAGLDITVSGDEVWVSQGTYVERITLKDGAALYGGFAGNETARNQRNFTTNITILDGNQGGTVVVCPTGLTSSARIDGLTIKNGNGWSGGGIYCNSSSPTITNNTISNNRANSTHNGGGINCVASSSPLITNNIITSNNADNYGGGIYCENSLPTIANNTIVSNNAPRGGGVYCNNSAAVITNNTFSGNTSSYGGGISCYASSDTIANNLIKGNTASSYGGGIYIALATPNIVNNTIADNSGYGIYCYSTSATIANNIAAFNSRNDIYKASGGNSPVLKNNCVYDPGGYHYAGIAPGTDDIQVDPLFMNRIGGNYHLATGSPCIDVGYDGAVQNGWVDMDGYPRINGTHVDIGADEYTPQVYTPISSPSGMQFNSAPQTIMITCSTSGAVIRYTTDGSDPTETSMVITSGDSIPISQNTVLKAKAWKEGYTESFISSSTYTFITATPTFTPEGGIYTSAQTVTVNCSTPDVIIHYTTNGQDPTETDPTISSGSTLNINPYTILKAKAYKTNWLPGDTKTASYANPIVYVKSNGNDANEGSTWGSAKKTVQAGVNITVPGTEVWVAQGTYVERITMKDGVGLYGGFIGNETTRNQRNYSSNVTILDGNQSGSVVTVPSGLSSPTQVDGFTIRNGKKGPFGGGVYSLSPITIANNIITMNYATSTNVGVGGGIYCEGSATITGNTISQNCASGQYVAQGSGIGCGTGSQTISNNTIVNNSGEGISCSSGSTAMIDNNIITGNSSNGIDCQNSSPTITNNTITTNQYGGIRCYSATPTISNNTINNNSSPSTGGGIYSDNSSAIISGNIISGNISTFGEGGGGIYCYHSAPTISNNTISGNRSQGTTGNCGGGGIHCEDSSPLISNNLIISNYASSTVGHGGGIYCDNSSDAKLTNNTIADNSAYSGGGISIGGSSPTIFNNIVAFNNNGIDKYTFGVPILNNNCVNNPSGYNYSSVSAGTGDIEVDPLFVNRAAGDYHLSSGSPCINAGLNNATGIQTTDYDGSIRIQGGTVDIGAYEFTLPDMAATDISGTKLAAKDAWVDLPSMTVSASFTGYFYLEADDRTKGIRVDKASHGLSVGMKAHVLGHVKTNENYERYIDANLAAQSGTGSVKPIAMINRYIGGGDWQYDSNLLTGQAGVKGGTGLNNIGLLVTTWGSFTYVDSQTFTVNDGSGTTVKCVVPSGVTLNASWQKVIVSGISSCEKVGTDVNRLIRVRTQDDIIGY